MSLLQCGLCIIHYVTCYSNSLLSCIHVITMEFMNIRSTLVATKHDITEFRVYLSWLNSWRQVLGMVFGGLLTKFESLIPPSMHTKIYSLNEITHWPTWCINVFINWRLIKDFKSGIMYSAGFNYDINIIYI